MRALELTGQRFERLLVLSRAGIDNHGKITWLCRCDCGTEKIINGGSLKRGLTLSCGCLNKERAAKRRFVNRVGQRFGRLLVLSHSKTDERGAYWFCRCDCGKEKITTAELLVRGESKSCGCLKRELLRDKITIPNACKVRGPAHPRWKGGITPENHRIRNSEEYKNWRKAVFVRDGYRCQECGSGSPLNAHHLRPFAYFPELRFEISNGQTLCIPCHEKTDTYFSAGCKQK